MLYWDQINRFLHCFWACFLGKRLTGFYIHCTGHWTLWTRFVRNRLTSFALLLSLPSRKEINQFFIPCTGRHWSLGSLGSFRRKQINRLSFFLAKTRNWRQMCCRDQVRVSEIKWIIVALEDLRPEVRMSHPLISSNLWESNRRHKNVCQNILNSSSILFKEDFSCNAEILWIDVIQKILQNNR